MFKNTAKNSSSNKKIDLTQKKSGGKPGGESHGNSEIQNTVPEATIQMTPKNPGTVQMSPFLKHPGSFSKIIMRQPQDAGVPVGVPSSSNAPKSPISIEIEGLWDPKNKGAYYNKLRKLNKLEREDYDLRNFVYTLSGDDNWLSINILEYGEESTWPVYMKIQYHMKGFSGSKGRDEVFRLIREEGQNTYQLLLKAVIYYVFAKSPDDLWLAGNLVKYGPEPLWPAAELDKRALLAKKNNWTYIPIKTTVSKHDNFKNKKGADIKLKHEVEMYFFQGKKDKKALVIGGAHGSEQAGIQVVEMLIDRLKKTQPCYTTIVVPVLFKRNADRAASSKYSHKKLTGSALFNKTRYTKLDECPADAVVNGKCVDPNRNLPKLGADFDPKNSVDHEGRTILTPNQILLELIDRFKPERIANVHSIKSASHSGFFADPHLDKNAKYGAAEKKKSYEDWDLAIKMAQEAKKHGAEAKGNKFTRAGKVGKNTSAIIGGGIKWKKAVPRPSKKKKKKGSYYSSRGEFYKPSGKEEGTSLGDYASTGTKGRKSITILTIETDKYHQSKDRPGVKNPSKRLKELEAHTIAIQDIFLSCP